MEELMKVEHWEQKRPISAWLPKCDDDRYIKEHAGKKLQRPVVNLEECNLCSLCWVCCPDGAISRNNDSIEINYEDCRGCGICALECPRGLIVMTEEPE
jgi:pyruvate ferredoxin oxidoreductase delta subunit